MRTLATTRLSSRGQVVIPESIRQRLGLRTGDCFVVVGHGDVVILKTLSSPDPRAFGELVGQARKAAKAAGLTKDHVKKAIRRTRRKP